MTIRHASDPDEWDSIQAGKGTCFHRALARWTVLHNSGDHRWRVAIGVVDSDFTRTRNVHAWLECGDTVLSAVDGKRYHRIPFYLTIRVEPETVRLINPRTIVRAGPIDRAAVERLLAAWGGHWRIDGGGVVAD